MPDFEKMSLKDKLFFIEKNMPDVLRYLHVNEVVSSNFSRMSLKDQLISIEAQFPDAWEYLHDIAGTKLPKYDDNDEVVSWGVTPQDTLQDVNKKEDMQ